MNLALPLATPRASRDVAASPWKAHVLPGLPWASAALRVPFDLMRLQHAQAVRAGLLTGSLLESREFERGVHALESLCLGPLARRV